MSKSNRPGEALESEPAPIETKLTEKMRQDMSDAEKKEETDEGRFPIAGDRLIIEADPRNIGAVVVAQNTKERLYRMINGFHEAGDLLAKQSEVAPFNCNLLYPAIFAYRQSLELRLKYFLMACGPLAGELPYFRDHDLSELWSKCKRMYLSFEGRSEPADNETFQVVENLFAEFMRIDPGSDAFRFAHDRKGQAVVLNIQTVDLRNLRETLCALHNFLECLDCQLKYGHDITPLA